METNLNDLYLKYHSDNDIKYYVFYNNFRDEFFNSLKNNFSKIILKYGLDETFIFEHKNLLGHLACYVSDDKIIDFFKNHFTQKQLEYMANYINCIGSTVLHYSVMQIRNINLLKFLLSLSKNIDDKLMDEAYSEYGRNYVMNSEWGKVVMENINNVPEKENQKKRNRLEEISSISKKLSFYNNYSFFLK